MSKLINGQSQMGNQSQYLDSHFVKLGNSRRHLLEIQQYPHLLKHNSYKEFL